jgi:hypothetical protein
MDIFRAPAVHFFHLPQTNQHACVPCRKKISTQRRKGAKFESWAGTILSLRPLRLGVALFRSRNAIIL